MWSLTAWTMATAPLLVMWLLLAAASNVQAWTTMPSAVGGGTLAKTTITTRLQAASAGKDSAMSTTAAAAAVDKQQQATTTPPRMNNHVVPLFLQNTFQHTSDCDDVMRPPSLQVLLAQLRELTVSNDVRGTFVDHARLGPLAPLSHELMRKQSHMGGGGVGAGAGPMLTPLAAYCLGAGFARFVLQTTKMSSKNNDDNVTILVGQDPRHHGPRLVDAFCRGAESVRNVACQYTGLATTPACASLPRLLTNVDAACCVTASHLPANRNGFKLFTRNGGGVTTSDMQVIGAYASHCLQELYNHGQVPPSSGGEGVQCSAWVDAMPAYTDSLATVLQTQLGTKTSPLTGLNIVVNAGHGAGGFLVNLLEQLGANVTGSMGVQPDGRFPLGVPNPESKSMLEQTMRACAQVQADLGVMLDTDADRCGFCVPARRHDENDTVTYEPLHRNRLIALLGVLLAETEGSAAAAAKIVTDSVTSEGLATFLQDLGLQHVRYVKGYANVIAKAQQLNAAIAIETSGHCAMRENHYVDDGTYVAVKVIGLLARLKKDNDGSSMLDLISTLDEMDEVVELRMTTHDGTLATMQSIFDVCALEVERVCTEGRDDWELDGDNLEGVRVRVGNDSGQFFMLRKSLHDPIVSLQIEARSAKDARDTMVTPLLSALQANVRIANALNLTALVNY